MVNTNNSQRCQGLAFSAAWVALGLLAGCGGGDVGGDGSNRSEPQMAPLGQGAQTVPPPPSPPPPLPPPQLVKLARSVESLRCDMVSRFRIPEMESAIAQAGLEVRSRSCAWNGLTYSSACGTAIPFYRVIEVAQNQVEKAGALGYKGVAEFPALLSTPCPNQDPPAVRVPPRFLANGLVENSYIVTFQPATATRPSVIWPQTTDPALKAALPIPRMDEHGTAQSRTELAKELGIKGQVIYILTSMNAATFEMDAAEAEKLTSDPRVLRVEQDRWTSAN